MEFRLAEPTKLAAAGRHLESNRQVEPIARLAGLVSAKWNLVAGDPRSKTAWRTEAAGTLRVTGSRTVGGFEALTTLEKPDYCYMK